MYIVWLTLA